jgi:hypothetical protein
MQQVPKGGTRIKVTYLFTIAKLNTNSLAKPSIRPEVASKHGIPERFDSLAVRWPFLAFSRVGWQLLKVLLK